MLRLVTAPSRAAKRGAMGCLRRAAAMAEAGRGRCCGRFRADPAHNCGAPCGVLATQGVPSGALSAQAGAFREWLRSVNWFTDADKPCRALSN